MRSANDNHRHNPPQGLFSLINLMRLGVAGFILCYFAYLAGLMEWPYLDRNVPSITSIRFPEKNVLLTKDARYTVLYGDEAELTRKPHLVVFWATWCGVCKRKLPHLIRRAQEFADQGMGVVLVASDNSKLRSSDDLPDWAKAPGVLVLKDDARDIFRRYGIRSVPSYALMSAKGKVVALASINVHGVDLPKSLAGLAAPGG